MDGNIIISYFGGINNIFADCKPPSQKNNKRQKTWVLDSRSLIVEVDNRITLLSKSSRIKTKDSLFISNLMGFEQQKRYES